jgi:hypothetical protein
MRDAEHYRAQSEFYAEMAEAMKRPDYQDRWLRLAQQSRELAERQPYYYHVDHRLQFD